MKSCSIYVRKVYIEMHFSGELNYNGASMRAGSNWQESIHCDVGMWVRGCHWWGF